MIYKLPNTIKELRDIIIDLEKRGEKLKTERDSIMKELRAYRQIAKRIQANTRANTGPAQALPRTQETSWESGAIG